MGKEEGETPQRGSSKCGRRVVESRCGERAGGQRHSLEPRFLFDAHEEGRAEQGQADAKLLEK